MCDGDCVSSLQEACLRRLAQGLLIYTVLLKHVEKEYPSSLVPSEATQIRNSLGNLIDIIKKRVGLSML